MSLQQTSVDAAANQSLTPEANTSQDEQSRPDTRSQHVLLLAVRALWLAVMALAVIFTIAAISVRYDKLLNFQSAFLFDSTTARGDLAPEAVQHGLEQLGLSPQFYATYNVALESVVVLGFLIVGAVIFSRKVNDWMAIAVSLTLITFGPSLIYATYALVAAQPEWRIGYNIFNLGWLAFGVVFFALFPDGRIVPGWMRFWCVAWVAFTLYWPLVPADSPYHPENWPGILLPLVLGGLLAGGVYAQVYRYRKISGPVRRHQTKWVVFGMTVFFIALISTFLFAFLPHESGDADSTRLFVDLVALPFYYAFLLCLPVSVGLSVLRYRLYDIDIIINRTLVYVPLTAILAGLYSASIVVSQRLFVAVTGEKSDAAIVITTLLLTVTFTPIKNLLQQAVDRRFKENHETTRKLKAFDQQVKSVEEVLDTEQIAKRLLDEACQAFNATSGAVYLTQGGEMRLIQASDDWRDEASLTVPLESNGKEIGLLKLGARSDRREYTPEDRKLLQGVADRVAHVVQLAEGHRQDRATV